MIYLEIKESVKYVIGEKTLSPTFVDETSNLSSMINVIVEICLKNDPESDDLTLGLSSHRSLEEESNQKQIIRIGWHSGIIYSVENEENKDFYGVLPALGEISSLSNQVDTEGGYSTRGKMDIAIVGKEIIDWLIENHYLYGKQVTVKEGFVTPGFKYEDYTIIFRGLITNWDASKDELELEIEDNLTEIDVDIPVELTEEEEEEGKPPNYIDYRAMNPIDIILDILITQIGISEEFIKTSQIEKERDQWFIGWNFYRVLTSPTSAEDYLNELQIETNTFLIHDGQQIILKSYYPATPDLEIKKVNDENNILLKSFKIESGYDDAFYNKVDFYYDYDEDGGDEESEAYESIYTAEDLTSQEAWGEVKTKTIYSKWIRSLSWDWEDGYKIKGITIYHISIRNSPREDWGKWSKLRGKLNYRITEEETTEDDGSITKTFTKEVQYKDPRGFYGDWVTIDDSGLYTIVAKAPKRYIRIIVDAEKLPNSSETGRINISPFEGKDTAKYLATNILNKYKNPAATVKFEIDFNDAISNNKLLLPADYIDITTNESLGKLGEGEESPSPNWTNERLLILEIEPNVEKGKVEIKAIQTHMKIRYAFISPAEVTENWYDYSEDSWQRSYCFVGGTYGDDITDETDSKNNLLNEHPNIDLKTNPELGTEGFIII